MPWLNALSSTLLENGPKSAFGINPMNEDLSLDDQLRAIPRGLAEPLDGDLVMEQPKPKSKTAIKHDRWSSRRGRQWASSDVGKAATKRVEADEERVNLAADMLSMAWEPCPEFLDECECEGRRQYLSRLLESPEYQGIHRDTALDEMASELAAASFTSQWLDLVAERQEKSGPESNPEGPSDEDDVESEARMQRHVSKALSEAKDGVQELNDTRDALGLGGEGGTDGSMSVEDVKKQFARIKDNRSLRRIMELSGKYLRLAKSMQSSKFVHGPDDVVGIEYGNDLSRVLPSELALLMDEDLELEFMRKFVDRSLMCRELRTVEDEAKGPIVLVVDESGSMDGEPVANAKAIALAILWVARHQKRWACLVGFAGGTEGTFHVVPPGTNDTAGLIDWLSHFFSGGTTMDVPLDVLPRKWQSLGCPAGRTDIIQITDAVVDVGDSLASKFNAWKEANQVKMSTIVINSNKGQMEKVSDRTWTISQLGVEADAVKDCLSV